VGDLGGDKPGVARYDCPERRRAGMALRELTVAAIEWDKLLQPRPRANNTAFSPPFTPDSLLVLPPRSQIGEPRREA